MMDKVSVFTSPRILIYASGDSSESPEVENSSEVETETTVNESYVKISDLVEQSSLTNHLLAGIILFLGIIVGVICMSHFFSRFRSH